MTNDELTAIYNEANGLDPKRHNPITTERIFAAMREAILAEREACAKVCEAVGTTAKMLNQREAECAAAECADGIRTRSNVKYTPK